ncbi:MAG: hypothetical protein RL648_659 [Verrucomicrobiota bacterium]|jgi:phosphatidylinositol alpha-1,6-mannosyltransferase
MPVQIVTHEYRPFRGGIAYYAEELARASAAGGVETEVWAPGYGACGWERTGCLAINRVKMRGRQDWWSRMRMRAALRRERGNGLGTVVLVEPGPIRLWMGAWGAGLPQAQRLVVVLHGTELRQLSRGWQRRRFGELLERAAVVGVVSTAVEELLRQRYPELSTPVRRVPGAVRAAWASLEPESRPRSDGRLRLLQVGRISPRKGQDLTVEAVAMLDAATRERIEVVCVGPVGKGDYFRGLRKRVEADRLPIRFVGEVADEDLVGWYRWADLALFPSRPSGESMEGLGLAALEASHFGLPVIATRLGGIPEAVLDGRTGRLVVPEPAALAAAVADCLADPGPYGGFGEAGAAYVREAFSWTRNAAILGLIPA